MIKIVLNGEPKSTSHIYKYTSFGGKGVRGYMSSQGKDLKDSYAWQAKALYRGKPFNSALHISCTLFFGTKRKADIDNFNKLWLDALTGILWEDDSQIQELNIRKDYDKERPRIELSIKEII